ncbi:MAG: sulfite exporter TauE/SafE family protein [Methylococcales bacterium]|nr:sulfite exporter TauE/SafE family protein [Methylococcales bacterium]
MSQRTQSLVIRGMHCAGCEVVIENAVKQLPGVDAVSADYAGDSVKFLYDDALTSVDMIISCIENQGYQAGLETFSNTHNFVQTTTNEGRNYIGLRTILKKSAAVILALIGIGFILWLDSWFMNHSDMPKLGRDISYGLLILIGFLTSFHCVGMCGPLILGYTAKSATSGHKSYNTHFLYGIGKTISYTLIGSLFGAFGSVLAFTPYTQGAAGVAAGIFLILFGLHMLEVFPTLRHFQFKTPAFLTNFVGKEYRKHSNPFVIGLLNGLMIICGPLQAMYVMAAGTGSWTGGAAILFFFGIGTLPLLMGFGFLTSLLSANLTPKILKASGFIVMILGAIMLNRGLAVTGTGIDCNTLIARVSQKLSPAVAESPSCDAIQTINMDVLKSGFSPNKFTLRKGVPVKWVINGKELNECNKAIVVPQYELKIELQPGIKTIEFTPHETGVVPWSCWMGMIPGTFIVVDNELPPKQNDAPATQPDEQKYPVIEAYRQRVIHEVKQLWQRLESSYQDNLAGKQ